MAKKEKVLPTNKTMFECYEINILLDNDNVDSFEIPYDKKSFKHEGKQYRINNRMIYLLPTKDYYKPVLYYVEGRQNPINIKNRNIGIPARVLHLLWDSSIYSVIMTFDTDRINKLIIILLLITAGMYGIGLYLTYGG